MPSGPNRLEQCNWPDTNTDRPRWGEADNWPDDPAGLVSEIVAVLAIPPVTGFGLNVRVAIGRFCWSFNVIVVPSLGGSPKIAVANTDRPRGSSTGRGHSVIAIRINKRVQHPNVSVFLMQRDNRERYRAQTQAIRNERLPDCYVYVKPADRSERAINLPKG